MKTCEDCLLVHVNIDIYCSDCGSLLPLPCETCDGYGKGLGHDSRGEEASDMECPDCNGSGSV